MTDSSMPKFRTSFCSEETFKVEEVAQTRSVYTRVPTKWLLIDTETGEVYRGAPAGQVNTDWNKLRNINTSAVVNLVLNAKVNED